jgi:hypothetical protein
MAPNRGGFEPIGKTPQQMLANPEGMRAWEDLKRRRWAELAEEMRQDALAQARFNKKAKATFGSGLLILRALCRSRPL